MRGKQFCRLNIMITEKKLHPRQTLRRKKAFQNKLLDQILFPEDLNESFHQGLLSNSQLSFQNTKPEVKGPPASSKIKRMDNTLPPESQKSMQLVQEIPVGKEHPSCLPLSPEFPKLRVLHNSHTRSRRKFPKTQNKHRHEQAFVTKTHLFSCRGGGQRIQATEMFSIPETPFIPKSTLIISPETPFFPSSTHVPKIPNQNQNANVCTMVPETPLLLQMPVNNVKKRPAIL